MLLFPLFLLGAFALNITRILQDIAKKDQQVDEGYRSNILSYSVEVLKLYVLETLDTRMELAEAIVSFQQTHPVPSDVWSQYLADICQFLQENFSSGALENLEKFINERVGSEVHAALVQLEKCILLLQNLQNLFQDHYEIINTLQRIKKQYYVFLAENIGSVQKLCDVFPVWPRLRHLLGLPTSMKNSGYEFQEDRVYGNSFMNALDNQFDISEDNFESLFTESSADQLVKSEVQEDERKDWPYNDYITSFSRLFLNGNSPHSLLIFKYFACRGFLTPNEKKICDDINIDLFIGSNGFVHLPKYSVDADDFRRNIQVPRRDLKEKIATTMLAFELSSSIDSGEHVFDDMLVPKIRVSPTNFLIEDIFIPLLELYYVVSSRYHWVDFIEDEILDVISDVTLSLEDVVAFWPPRFRQLIHPAAFDFSTFSNYITTDEGTKGLQTEILNLDGFRDDFFSTYEGFLPSFILRSLKKNHFRGRICYMYQSSMFRSDQDIPFDCLKTMEQLTVFFSEANYWQRTVVPYILSMDPKNFSTIREFIEFVESIIPNFEKRSFLEFLRQRISMILGEKLVSEIADAVFDKSDYSCPFTAVLFMNTPGRLLKYAFFSEQDLGHNKIEGQGMHYNGTYDMRAIYTWVLSGQNFRYVLHKKAYIANGYSVDHGGPMRNYLQQCLDFIKNGIDLKSYKDLMSKLGRPFNLVQDDFLGPLFPEKDGISFFPFRASSQVGKFVGTILAKALERNIHVDILFPADFFQVLFSIREKGMDHEDVKRQVVFFHDKMYPKWKEMFLDIDKYLDGDLKGYSFPSPNFFIEPFKTTALYELEQIQNPNDVQDDRVAIVDKNMLSLLKYSIIVTTYSEFRSLLFSFSEAFSYIFDPLFLSIIDFERFGTLFGATSYTTEDVEARLRFLGDSQTFLSSLVVFFGATRTINFETCIRIILRTLSPEMMKKFFAAITGSSTSRLENTTFNISCSEQHVMPYESSHSTEDAFGDKMNFVIDFYTKVYETQVAFMGLDTSATSMVPLPKHFVGCETATCASTMNFMIAREISDGSSVTIVRDFGSVVLAFLQQMLLDSNDIKS